MITITKLTTRSLTSSFYAIVLYVCLGAVSQANAGQVDIVLSYQPCGSLAETRNQLEVLEAKLKIKAAKFGVKTEWSGSTMSVSESSGLFNGTVRFTEDLVEVRASLSSALCFFNKKIRRNLDREFQAYFASNN